MGLGPTSAPTARSFSSTLVRGGRGADAAGVLSVPVGGGDPTLVLPDASFPMPFPDGTIAFVEPRKATAAPKSRRRLRSRHLGRHAGWRVPPEAGRRRVADLAPGVVTGRDPDRLPGRGRHPHRRRFERRDLGGDDRDPGRVAGRRHPPRHTLTPSGDMHLWGLLARFPWGGIATHTDCVVSACVVKSTGRAGGARLPPAKAAAPRLSPRPDDRRLGLVPASAGRARRALTDREQNYRFSMPSRLRTFDSSRCVPVVPTCLSPISGLFFTTCTRAMACPRPRL